ncbi:MAG: DUF4416 family protein [Calditrichia bacterium]
MGAIKSPMAVKGIAAISVSDLSLWDDARAAIETAFSPIQMEMDWFEFHHTDYYAPEMGDKLKKKMVAFQQPWPLNALPEHKHQSNAIEQRFVLDEKRRVNIDPGYITAAKLVLATTKNFAHRIYLDRGIWGDLHLAYRDGRFQPRDWTYLDYREPDVIAFFTEVRTNYLRELGELMLEQKS